MFFEDTVFGSEAIYWNFNSKFRDDLVSVIKEAYEHKDQIANDILNKKKNISHKDFTLILNDKMYTYFTNTMKSRLHDVIKKHTNISFNIIASKQPKIEFGYAVEILIVPEDHESFESFINHFFASSGKSSRDDFDRDILFQNISEMFTGELKLNTKEFVKKYGESFTNTVLKTNMYFDLPTTFLLDYFLPKESYGIDPLTPEEVAAIILHEIGHYHTYIERIGYALLYSIKTTEIQSQVSKLLSNVSQSNMREKIRVSRELYSLLKEKLDNSSVHKYADASVMNILKLMDKVSVMLGYIENSLDTIENRVNNREPKIPVFDYILGMSLILISVLFDLFKRTFNVISGIVASYLILSLGALFFELIILKDSRNKEGALIKSFDLPKGLYTQFAPETWADDFVTRLGMGNYLISGLGKLETLIKYVNASNVLKQEYELSSRSGFKRTTIYKVFNFLTTIIYSAIDTLANSDLNLTELGMTHEPFVGRARSIMNSLKVFFRENINVHTDNPLIKDALKEFDKIETALQNYVEGEKRKIPIAIKIRDFIEYAIALIKSPISINTWYSMLSQHKYFDDIARSINVISNNELNILKHKLKMISE